VCFGVPAGAVGNVVRAQIQSVSQSVLDASPLEGGGE